MNKETIVLIPVGMESGELPAKANSFFVDIKNKETGKVRKSSASHFKGIGWSDIYTGRYHDLEEVIHWYKPVPLSSLIEEHTKELVQALEAVIRLKDLWLPNQSQHVTSEMEGEFQALDAMKNKIEQALLKHKGE